MDSKPLTLRERRAARKAKEKQEREAAEAEVKAAEEEQWGAVAQEDNDGGEAVEESQGATEMADQGTDEYNGLDIQAQIEKEKDKIAQHKKDKEEREKLEKEKTESELMAKRVKFRKRLKKWVPVLITGPSFGIYLCFLSFLVGSLVYEGLWDKFPDEDSINPGECNASGALRGFLLYVAFVMPVVFLLFNCSVLLGPGACGCCRVRTLRSVGVFYFFFGLMLTAGIVWGFVWRTAAIVCAKNTPILWTTASVAYFELLGGVGIIVFYIVWYFVNIYQERQKKKRMIAMMTKKVSFDFNAMASLRGEEKAEDDARRAAEEAKKKAMADKLAEIKRKQDAMKQEQELARKKAEDEAAARRAAFFGDDSDGEEDPSRQ